MVKYQAQVKEEVIKESVPMAAQKNEPYPKQEWAEIGADPELGKLREVAAYEKMMIILLWRILKALKK